MDKSQEMVITMLGPDDLQETLDFVLNNFFPRNPFLKMAKQTAKDSLVAVDMGTFLHLCLVDGSSFAARLKSTNELVGIRLNLVHTSNVDPAEYRKASQSPEELGYIYQIMETLLSDVDHFKEPDVHKVMECFMLCVRADFGGRGIGSKLTQKSVDLAADLDCQKVQVTIANSKAGKIFSNLNFQVIKTMELDGQPGLDVSLVAPEERYLTIMVKRLPVKTTDQPMFSTTFDF